MFEAMNRIGNNLYIDEVEVSVLTGVEELSNQKNVFRLYPNPSFGEVNLVFLQENMAVQISVFSLNGKLLHSVQAENVTGIREIPLSLGHLTKGAYIVKIIGSSYTLSKLLILN
jgi:hypothetical protein